MNIPRELQRSTPRSVSLSASGMFVSALSVLLGVGGVAGGALLYVNATKSVERVAVRAKDTATTTGVVQEVKRQKNDWRIQYTFEVGGRTVEGHTRLRPKMEPGTSVEVGYLPSDPGDNWIVGHEPKAMSFWLAPLFGLLQLVGAGLIHFKLRRDRYLLENGRPAVALATASKRVSNGKTVAYSTQFEYKQPSGAVVTGKLQSGSVIPVGTEFVIVYNPDQPKRVAKYPFTLYRIGD